MLQHSPVTWHPARRSAPALRGCGDRSLCRLSAVCSAKSPLQQQEAQRNPHSLHHDNAAAPPAAAAAATVAAAAARTAGAALCLNALQLALPDAAGALAARMEPANALSLPTWAIHVSSVTEWVAAMALMWKFADVSGNPRWKGMSWGMMPSLGSAMAACTWHFFYNSPDLDFLVALQAFLTVLGNCTCWLAAYRIYVAAQEQESSA